MIKIDEMRLFTDDGNRLYLTQDERISFLKASGDETRENRMFCYILHYTGCRPSEALELTTDRIHVATKEVIIRSLKKRAYSTSGALNKPKYRSIPIPCVLMDQIDLVFDISRRKHKSDLLFTMSRSTAWRLIKKVMDNAGIKGKQATSKGLRHGFGIAMLSKSNPLPLNILRDLMGHCDSKTTEIYLQAIGDEKRNLVMEAWDSCKEY